MGVVRIVVAAPAEHMSCLVSRVKALQTDGRRVVFVTANRPYVNVLEALANAGVAVEEVAVIDAITLANRPPPTEVPPNVSFVRSPTMLEMIVMRIEKEIVGHGDNAHLVLDHLNALQLYSGLPMVQQFSHYLINRVRSHRSGADLYVLPTEEGQAIERAIAAFTDLTEQEVHA